MLFSLCYKSVLTNLKDLRKWLKLWVVLGLCASIYHCMKCWMPCCGVVVDLDWLSVQAVGGGSMKYQSSKFQHFSHSVSLYDQYNRRPHQTDSFKMNRNTPELLMRGKTSVSSILYQQKWDLQSLKKMKEMWRQNVKSALRQKNIYILQ